MMKFLKISFFIFLFLFVFCLKAVAFEFVKSSANPLPIRYLQDYVHNFQAHIYKEGSVFKGIIPAKKLNQNNFSLVAIESSDGINWDMTKEIFINQGNDISNPRLVMDKDGNKKIFFAQAESSGPLKIFSIICDAILNCSSSADIVLEPDINDLTENRGFFAPYVLNLDKNYLFYGAWGQDGFKIRLAYSDDLSNWQKCQYDLITGGADGPFPYVENNNLYLFYHRSDSSGIKLSKTTLPIGCSSTFTDLGYIIWPDKSYDLRHMIYPSIVKDDEGLLLYYTGLGSDYIWHLNVASSGYTFPKLTPTIIPSPTATPAPEKLPIIIIPGLLASWNKEAILNNKIIPQSGWQLNPMVKDYNAIIATLKNLDFQEGRDFFVFNYDWRKPVLNSVEDLHSFIKEKTGSRKINIIGHSLGGLIGRIYSQKYTDHSINRLITIGSPHYGASQTYNIVEAGQVDRFNNYLWLAIKMICTLNKNNLETDKKTVNRLFPVLKDLFPVYNFLKKNGNDINISGMIFTNDLLSNESYKTNGSNLSYLTAIAGEKGNTLKGYNVVDQSIIDKLLDYYPDGHPVSSFSEIGDHTVLSSSAVLGTPVILNLDHGELIYRKEAIKKILDLLDIRYQDVQVAEGGGTAIDSSLIFLLRSPAAKMEVIYNGKKYEENEGMIFIENASNGTYQLSVNGNGIGDYQMIIGQIGGNEDIWENIFHVTGPGQSDSYNIDYQNDSLKNISNNDFFEYLKIKGYQITNRKNLKKILNVLIKNRDFIGLEKLENYRSGSNIQIKTDPEQISRELETIKENLSKQNKPVDDVVLEEIVKRINFIEKEYIKQNYRFCYFLLETIKKLENIVKKI